ncbi:MAG: GntR family transcriptional regulator [Erysipelotrichaceae bacterium]|nr:GntR family transcriptional regulator [Erysipelotrichaceae bacterium]
MSNLEFSKGSLPLYIQIKHIIKADIIEGKYNYGDLIPTELQIQKEYEISRITARQAILELENEGYVLRKRGKGTIVIYQKKIEENLINSVSFTSEMIEQGNKPGTKFVEVKTVKATESIAKIFGIKFNEELININRLRTSNDKVIVYLETFLLKDLNLPMEGEYYKNSLYEFFNSRNIYPYSYKEKISAICADKKLASLLEVDIKDPILVRYKTSFLEDGNVLEYTIGYYPASRYVYTISSKI